MATGNSELTRLTAADLSAALVAGEVSAVEAAQAQLDRIGEVDGELHAFLATDSEASLAAARSVDERRALTLGPKVQADAGLAAGTQVATVGPATE